MTGEHCSCGPACRGAFVLPACPTLQDCTQFIVNGTGRSPMRVTLQPPRRGRLGVAGLRQGSEPRRAVNVTPAEQTGRIAIGLATVIVGVAMLVSAGSVLTVLLEVLLIVAGFDLVVAGALGHRPLYQRLGYVPVSLVGRRD